MIALLVFEGKEVLSELPYCFLEVAYLYPLSVGIDLDTGDVGCFHRENKLEVNKLKTHQKKQYYFSMYQLSNLIDHVIVITGLARSGKDSLSSFIEKIYPEFHFINSPISYEVYRIRNLLFGTTVQKNRNQLVKIGQGLREKIHENIWIVSWLRNALCELNHYEKNKFFVVADVRQQNEYDFFKSLNSFLVITKADENKRLQKIIEIDGKQEINYANNETENKLSELQFNYTFSNNYTELCFERQKDQLTSELNKYFSNCYDTKLIF